MRRGPAPHRLRGVQRRVMAQRDEGVLQRRAESACAWTSPVATHGTPRRCARCASPRLRARSWRWKGRWSSTRRRRAEGRAAGATSARRARRGARSRSEACSSSVSSEDSGGTRSRSALRVAAAAAARPTVAMRARDDPAQVAPPPPSSTRSVTDGRPPGPARPGMACSPSGRPPGRTPSSPTRRCGPPAPWPRSRAPPRRRSSSGSEALSRNEKAEGAELDVHEHMFARRADVGLAQACWRCPRARTAAPAGGSGAVTVNVTPASRRSSPQLSGCPGAVSSEMRRGSRSSWRRSRGMSWGGRGARGPRRLGELWCRGRRTRSVARCRAVVLRQEALLRAAQGSRGDRRASSAVEVLDRSACPGRRDCIGCKLFQRRRADQSSCPVRRAIQCGWWMSSSAEQRRRSLRVYFCVERRRRAHVERYDACGRPGRARPAVRQRRDGGDPVRVEMAT